MYNKKELTEILKKCISEFYDTINKLNIDGNFSQDNYFVIFNKLKEISTEYKYRYNQLIENILRSKD